MRAILKALLVSVAVFSPAATLSWRTSHFVSSLLSWQRNIRALVSPPVTGSSGSSCGGAETGWRKALLISSPQTVVRWHRAGFKVYCKWISHRRRHSGRKPTSKALRELIFRMVADNPTWGAPRIHGELKMLGWTSPEHTVLAMDAKSPSKSRSRQAMGSLLEQRHQAD